MRRRTGFALVVLAACGVVGGGFAGCSNSNSAPPGADSGVSEDTGAPDVAVADTGAAVDSGSDSGSVSDAGTDAPAVITGMAISRRTVCLSRRCLATRSRSRWCSR